MGNSLYKYFSNLKWAEMFINGQVHFRSLSYFRDYEDRVRGDRNEGTSIMRPKDGLEINNLTQGNAFTIPNTAFTSSVKHEEIFIFSASKSETERHRKEFNAVACVEIKKVKVFYERIRKTLPQNATFFGQRIEYYPETESGNVRWALPEKIATSKLNEYPWQDEYRLLFSSTHALDFEKSQNTNYSRNN